MRRVSIAMALLVLAGCAANPSPPIEMSTAPNAAKVRLIAQGPRATLTIYPQTICNTGKEVLFNVWGRAKAGELQGKPPPRVEMYDAPFAANDYSVAEFAFAAGQILNVGARPSCLKAFSLRMNAGEQYEVALSVPSCDLTVARLIKTGSEVRRETIRPPELGQLICDGKLPPFRLF
jgi:hypothetical protein